MGAAVSAARISDLAAGVNALPELLKFTDDAATIALHRMSRQETPRDTQMLISAYLILLSITLRSSRLANFNTTTRVPDDSFAIIVNNKFGSASVLSSAPGKHSVISASFRGKTSMRLLNKPNARLTTQ